MVDNNYNKLKIFYGIGYGRYVPGFFNDIPKDIHVAEIVHNYSTVNKDGNIINNEESYKMFIGDVYDVDELLKRKNDYETESVLLQYKEEGYKLLVTPKNKKISDRYFYSFNEKNDRVFDNYEDFKNAIIYFSKNFKSIDYNVNNNTKKKILTLHNN